MVTGARTCLLNQSPCKILMHKVYWRSCVFANVCDPPPPPPPD